MSKRNVIIVSLVFLILVMIGALLFFNNVFMVNDTSKNNEIQLGDRECYSNADCGPGKKCNAGTCENNPSYSGGTECGTHSDCGSGKKCYQGKCIDSVDTSDPNACISNVSNCARCVSYDTSLCAVCVEGYTLKNSMCLRNGNPTATPIPTNTPTPSSTNDSSGYFKCPEEKGYLDNKNAKSISDCECDLEHGYQPSNGSCIKYDICCIYNNNEYKPGIVSSESQCTSAGGEIVSSFSECRSKNNVIENQSSTATPTPSSTNDSSGYYNCLQEEGYLENKNAKSISDCLCDTEHGYKLSNGRCEKYKICCRYKDNHFSPGMIYSDSQCEEQNGEIVSSFSECSSKNSVIENQSFNRQFYIYSENTTYSSDVPEDCQYVDGNLVTPEASENSSNKLCQYTVSDDTSKCDGSDSCYRVVEYVKEKHETNDNKNLKMAIFIALSGIIVASVVYAYVTYVRRKK